ncbi:MAG: hypothetical protein LBU98_00730 [Alistipes sp.]|jgi:hypothetical protein|nr:hypothetical protein [Alistipes sp.]
MKKTNFFKLLMLGAAALTLGFAGCQNGPSDKEFEELCTRMTTAENSINDIQTEINKGFVTKVDKKAGTTNTWVFTYNNGSTFELTVDGSGPGPTGGDYLSVGENGNWMIGSTDTGAKASATTPKIQKDATDGKLYWYFPVVGADNKIEWSRGEEAIAASYVTEVAGAWELWIIDANGKMIEKPIIIGASASGLTKIDILGWTTGKGATSQDISSAELNLATYFSVNYAWVERFQQEDNYTAATGTFANKAAAYAWSAQTEVAVKNVLNTLGAERKGLVVQVAPANTDLASMVFTLENSKNEVLPVVLEEAELLTGLLTRAASSSALYFIPMTYQDKSVTYDRSTPELSEVAGNKKYEALYRIVNGQVSIADINSTAKNPLYTLVEKNTGFRSEYTPFTFVPNIVNSLEAPVDQLISGTTAIDDASNAPIAGQSYRVLPNVPYSVTFGDGTPHNAAPLTSNAHPYTPVQLDLVVDYYVEVKDNNEYVQSQFGITVDKANGTFTIGRMPDNLTLATFTLTVYKLGVDGKIYVEDIVIYPVRANLSEVIYENPSYTVTDENGFGTPFTAGPPASAQLSQTATADMAAMFTKLATEPSGIGGMTMKERWQNITYGAKYWNITSVTIGGKAVNGADYTQSALLGGATQTLNDWKTMFYNGGGQIVFSKNDTGTGANNVTGPMTPAVDGTMPAPNLYDARYIILKPAYAQSNGSTPMFEIGQEYVVTFEFYDAAEAVKGNYLSTAVVKFTPVLPALNELFVKEDIYWTADKTTLNAYYKRPSSWYATTGVIGNWFYGENDYATPADANVPFAGTVGSTYYNVYSTQALNSTHANKMSYDGGFLRFGQPNAATDKQWLDATTALVFPDANGDGDSDQKIGDDFVSDLATIGTTAASGVWSGNPYLPANAGTRTIVELLGQTPTPATANAYDNELNMSVVPGLYLGVYDYANYDAYDAAVAALDFKMKIMSALDKGTIVGTGAGAAIPIPAGSTGKVSQIKEAAFDAKNYNKEVYNIFPKYTHATTSWAYEYPYIRQVEFYVPTSAGTAYNFADVNGNVIVGAVTTGPIMPAAVNNAAEAYVAIISNNLSQLADVKLGVRVIDRFGRAKEVEIPFTIVQQ